MNDINFENMSNDDAVRVLRDIVHKPGWAARLAEVLFSLNLNKTSSYPLSPQANYTDRC